MTEKFRINPFTAFYFVFGYILMFSIWWGYLLYAKNEAAFTEMVQLNTLQHQAQHPGVDYTSTTEYLQIADKYFRQRLMIVLEGSVFILLLVAGLFFVRKVFKRELELAGLQRNFMLSVTHELKSPISTVKLSLQTLQKHSLQPEQKQKIIDSSLTDVNRLEDLVDNILMAAKIERNDHGLTAENLDISALTEKICSKFQSNKKNVRIISSATPNIHIQIDPTGFTSILTNLIENAIKYSPEGSTVQVALQTKGEQAELLVCDEGCGVPDEEKGKVFNKFYRVGNEDTRKTKGTGLGLYIVKRFVEIFNGTIDIRDNTPTGSIFTVHFPVQPH